MQVPHPKMFDTWPEEWKWDTMKTYYDKVAEVFHLTENPSTDGVHYLNGTGGDLLKGALDPLGFKESNPVYATAFTMGVPYVTVSNGVRQSTASVYLPPAMKRSNFEYMGETTVSEILQESGRALGVRCRDVNGRQFQINLKDTGLLVLTGGVFNTAKLLLANNLGNGQVGKQISDHTHKTVTYSRGKMSGLKGFDPSQLTPGQVEVEQYKSYRSGPMAQFGPTWVAYFSASENDHDAFDVEAWVSPIGENKLSLGFVLMRPTCSHADISIDADGTLKMDGALYLGCSEDEAMLSKTVSQVSQQVGQQPDHPWDGKGDSMNHWSGSCKLGDCVDPKTLTVIGTQNVFVADSSIFPNPIWGHPTYTLIASALRAADILEQQLK